MVHMYIVKNTTILVVFLTIYICTITLCYCANCVQVNCLSLSVTTQTAPTTLMVFKTWNPNKNW